MVDDRPRIVLGYALAVGAVLRTTSGKSFTVAHFDPSTMEATLEPHVEREIEIMAIARTEPNYFPAPQSKYLPGNPQPWKRRRK